MKHRLLALTALMLIATVPAEPQTNKPAPKVYKAPRTPDGQPDLQGFWTNNTYVPLERPKGVTKEFYTEAEAREMERRAAQAESEQTAPGTIADVHYDFTQFGLVGTGSRYGAAVAEYYTLAWFDRYLRGAQPDGAALAADARRRLTATTFDDSEDVHDISAGQFDPATQSNVPAYLARQPVVDRLSFHFRSGYWLDGGAAQCDDIRRGCP